MLVSLGEREERTYVLDSTLDFPDDAPDDGDELTDKLGVVRDPRVPAYYEVAAYQCEEGEQLQVDFGAGCELGEELGEWC